MSTILEFRPSVRAQLVASHDLLDLGEAMCLAGSTLVQAGYEVMRMNEHPSEDRLRQFEAIASMMLQKVQSIRLQAFFAAGQVQMPADCEPVA